MGKYFDLHLNKLIIHSTENKSYSNNYLNLIRRWKIVVQILLDSDLSSQRKPIFWRARGITNKNPIPNRI